MKNRNVEALHYVLQPLQPRNTVQSVDATVSSLLDKGVEDIP
jgi:hypothetical protein